MKLSEIIAKYGDVDVDISPGILGMETYQKPALWRPEKGNKYYVIDDSGDILYMYFNGDTKQENQVKYNNWFLSYEEAHACLLYRKCNANRETIIAKLLQCDGARTRYKTGVDNYCIILVKSCRVQSLNTRDIDIAAPVYFDTLLQCQKAINEIGENFLTSYYFI